MSTALSLSLLEFEPWPAAAQVYEVDDLQMSHHASVFQIFFSFWINKSQIKCRNVANKIPTKMFQARRNSVLLSSGIKTQ